ncbi:MAG: dTMP kinase [Pseudomonadota bacterium]
MTSLRRAPFIVFEGADGVGKSTQAARLAERFAMLGVEALLTREPGGTPNAERIRDLVVSGAADDWSPISETLLMYAARAEHLRSTINPARAKGTIVICDRFSDSTRAYQGAAGAAPATFIEALDREVVGGDGPTLTVVLDLDEAAAAARIAARNGTPTDDETRFEDKGQAFQQKARAAFREIAERSPATHVIVDASDDPDVVADKISAHVEPIVTAWRAANG